MRLKPKKANIFRCVIKEQRLIHEMMILAQA